MAAYSARLFVSILSLECNFMRKQLRVTRGALGV